MAKKVNCSICGKEYELCLTCANTRSFAPWRAVSDTLNCYKIYLAIHAFSVQGNKAKAKELLSKCNLDDLDNFLPEKKEIIQQILAEPKKINTRTRKKKVVTEEDQVTE